jgi:uncharacterized protein YdeI (YjbR/CyaY-like superfamily)
MEPIPKDFLRALQQSGLEGFFAECPYLPRAGYLSWIAAAKRPETRRGRIRQSVVRIFAQWVDEVRVLRADFEASTSVVSRAA